jgi:nitric oxide reductase NorD protein
MSRVCFTEVQRVLALFAQGLAATSLHVRLIESGAAHRRASRIMSDGDSIYLPPCIADFASADENLGAYRIAVLHQIGYFVEGTFAFDLERFLASWHRPALLRRVFMTIEDLRIDLTIRRRYPGAAADLERVLAHARSSRPQIEGMRPLARLLEALLQYSLGAARDELVAHDPGGLLAGLIDAAAAVEKPAAGVPDSARAALGICTELESILQGSAPRVRAPRAAESSAMSADAGAAPLSEEELGGNDLDGMSVEFRGEVMQDRIAHRRRDNRSAAQGERVPSAATPVQVVDPAAADSSTSAASRALHAGVRPAIAAGPRSFLYDEWNYRSLDYLPSWCRVYEHRLRGDDFGFLGEVRRRHAALALKVRQQLRAIKPQSLLRVRRAGDGDELELDRIIEAMIDRRAGQADDSHWYLRRDRGLRDVAAAFLVDMSASTDFPIPNPQAAPAGASLPAEPGEGSLYLYGGLDDPADATPVTKRRVIDVSKDALGLMCDALHSLGDSFAIYGFSGDGRDNVEFHIAKEFGERLCASTWAALSAMQPRRSTRMGPAIRHALSKLAREPARVKILITVSDGYPEDHDYGADRTDREYGIQDTARAFQEVRRAGVVDFCVTIDPAGHDYLRRMCAQSRYLVIDEVAALPRELSKVYRTLTAALTA